MPFTGNGLRWSVLLCLIWLCACAAPDEPEINSSPTNVPSPTESILITHQAGEVVQALFSGDVSQRLNRIKFITTECTLAEGLGGPPKCTGGEVEGDRVEVFPVGGPEGSFMTPETIESILGFQVDQIHAIYRIPTSDYREDYWPAGEIGILFSQHGPRFNGPVTARVVKGRMVRLDYHLGQTIAGILANIPPENILIHEDEMLLWLANIGIEVPPTPTPNQLIIVTNTPAPVP